MIHILKFNSKDEDDMATYRLMMKAQAMHSVLHNFAQQLREKIKYSDMTKDYSEAVHDIHEIFYDECKENSVDPYE